MVRFESNPLTIRPYHQIPHWDAFVEAESVKEISVGNEN
jgi:hypothetical protein